MPGIVFHRHAASRGRHHDGFRTRVQMWQPRVDIAPHRVQPSRMIVEMKADRAATAGLHYGIQRNPESIQYPRRGGVDIRRECGLRATFQQQHFAWMCLRHRRPLHSLGGNRNFVFKRVWQQRSQCLTNAQQRGKESSPRNHLT